MKKAVNIKIRTNVEPCRGGLKFNVMAYEFNFKK